MERNVEISLLIDFYGRLLSDRQFEIIDLYYNNDLSLGEIANNLGISRQGVHDNLKRAEILLYSYEDKLNLVNKFQEQSIRIKEAIQKLDAICARIKDDLQARQLSHIKNILESIAEDV